MKPILIFDLADTLVAGFASIVEALAPRLNLPGPEILAGLGGEPLVALVEGRLSEATYWQQVLARTHWPFSGATLSAFLREIWRQPVPGMPELLGALHAYRRVLLADQAREWMADLDTTHPFLRGFDRRFLSRELGQTKRQVAIFERVIAALHCRPHDCIFIDDLPWNVERAQTIGMRATQFTSAAALREFLSQEGIEFSSTSEPGHGAAAPERAAHAQR
jgi:HAD superfamily hydrolase (TIGR01509 family)